MENYEKPVAEMIDRYIYSVTKRLQESQRADIDKELRGLIDDMLQDRTVGAPPRKEDIEAVLKELGRPSALAAKYRGVEQHLIGPEYFDLYTIVLKIVIIVAPCATAFAQIIRYAANPPVNALESIGMLFGSVIAAAIYAFALVTLIFAAIERFAKKSDILDEDWNPSDLPPVPAAKAVISRSECIVGIVFTVFAIIIFNVAPWLFGANDFSGMTFIPVFNLEVLITMLPLLNVMFCLGILKETARLIIGKYDFKLAISVTVLNILSLILFLYVFVPPAIWNADFMMSLYNVYGWDWAATPEAATAWAIFPKVIIGLTIFGHIVDTITVFVRSFIYSDTRKTIGKTH